MTGRSAKNHAKETLVSRSSLADHQAAPFRLRRERHVTRHAWIDVLSIVLGGTASTVSFGLTL